MDGWEAQCELILLASHGMDFSHFADLLLLIAEKRIKGLESESLKTNNYNLTFIFNLLVRNGKKSCTKELHVFFVV